MGNVSKLPRWAPHHKVTGKDLNLIASSIDSGGSGNLLSPTASDISGQGLSSPFPVSTGGSIVPNVGSVISPEVPVGLTLSYGIDHYSQTHDGYILATWSPNPVTDSVARYDLYWHKGSDPNLHQLTVGGDVTQARINSVIPGQTYIFAIQAHDTAGRASAFSLEVPIFISLDVDPPAAPTGLVATAIGSGINLTWTEVGSEGISNDLKQYQIAISTDSGSTFPTIRTIGPGNSYFYNPGLGAFSPGVAPTFTFKVASVDWTGNVSAYSSIASATLNNTFTVAGELEILNGDNSGGSSLVQIELGWHGSSPVPQYQHYLSTIHNGGDINDNKIKFWTSDTTANGVFPTNAVLGLTIANGKITVPTSITVGPTGTAGISTAILSSGSDNFFGQGAQGFR